MTVTQSEQATASGRNYALIIGIDAYRRRPLKGCVNDALAMAELLRCRFAVRDEEITLLLSPTKNRELPANARPATAAAIRSALQELGQSAGPLDRVIIHYSGHGGTHRTSDVPRRVVESLLPIDHDGVGCTLYDLEVQRYLGAIAEQTKNLTVVFDCCHSASVSRNLGVSRGIPLGEIDGSELELPATPQAKGLHHDDALTIAACLADEQAYETTDDSGQPCGRLTWALRQCLAQLRDDELATCSWRELWPLVLSKTTQQHPWIIGDDERLIFSENPGRDAGNVRVQGQPDARGLYPVLAGSLLDLSEGAQIAVYGTEPPTLPNPSDPGEASLRVGTLSVVETQPHSSLARAEVPFTWPVRARCRISSYGQPRLHICVEGELPAGLAEQLETLHIGILPSAPVRLVADQGEWVLCDECHGLADQGELELARFPSERILNVLSHCATYRAPLRLYQRCTTRALELHLLEATRATNPQNPDLPALVPDVDGRYRIARSTAICVDVGNHSGEDLQLTFVNVAASGAVQYLGDASVREGGRHAFWTPGRLGTPIKLKPPFGVERLVVIGTTARDRPLRHLATHEKFASVMRRRRDIVMPPPPPPPPPLWTAAMATVIGTGAD